MTDFKNKITIIGPEGLVHSVELVLVPRVGELIAIEGKAGFEVVQVVHHIGPDREGKQGQAVSIFVKRSESQYLPGGTK